MRLIIGDMVHVQVNFDLMSHLGANQFKFTLVCERRTLDQINSENRNIPEFMLDVTKGWMDQNLVIDEDGSFTQFSPDALRFAMSNGSLDRVFFNAYVKETVAREKN